MDDIVSRMFNPGVILTMVVAGLAYGYFLWTLNIQPVARLYAIAVVPGFVFGVTILCIRAIQGVPSVIWVLLLIDWLIFAHAGFLAVLARRRRGA